MSRIGSFGAACLCAVWLSAHGSALSGDAAPALTGGNGTIYLASYARRIAVIDEATERLTAEIPLKSGLAWAVRLSPDRSRFYVQSADAEHFEVVDLASRQSVDTFTLSESNKHVRVLAFDVDPQHRFLVAVAVTAAKLADRFEIGPPVFIQYDLKDHKVVKTVAWSGDVEPRQYYVSLRFSPDGRLLYVFAHEILIYDARDLKKIDSWNLSLPNDPGLGRLDLGSMDEAYDGAGFFTALFTVDDPVQKRPLVGVGRVNLAAKSIDFFPVGPAPERGEMSFALGADHKRGYVLREEIGRYQLWTIDIPARRLVRRIEFTGRPRMALRSSSNAKVIYVYEAGNTIDLHDAKDFKYLRTIALDADMMYGTFHVVPPRGQTRPLATPHR
jgi:hypothetical protein